MKTFNVIAFIILGVAVSCSMYHLQTPETVLPGHITGGIGTFLYASVPYVYPGVWVRTGITPKLDIGLSSWLLGVKADVKYRPFKFLALGTGLGGGYGLTLMESHPKSMGLFVGEGSLYLGYPYKNSFPYCVIRARGLYATYMWPASVMPVVTAVIGTCAPLAKNVTFYLEGGGMFFFGSENYLDLIGGVGISFGK